MKLPPEIAAGKPLPPQKRNCLMGLLLLWERLSASMALIAAGRVRQEKTVSPTLNFQL
jgi:hypothetical protein